MQDFLQGVTLCISTHINKKVSQIIRILSQAPATNAIVKKIQSMFNIKTNNNNNDNNKILVLT